MKLNKTQLAKELNVSAPYVSKLIKNGKLKFDKDGLIELDEAIKNLKNRTERTTNLTQKNQVKPEVKLTSFPEDLVKSRLSHSDVHSNINPDDLDVGHEVKMVKISDLEQIYGNISAEDLSKWKAINERIKAEKEEIELKQRKKEYVETSLVSSELFKLGSFVKEQVFIAVEKNFTNLSTINEPLKIRDELIRIFEDVFDNCANEIEKSVSENFTQEEQE